MFINIKYIFLKEKYVSVFKRVCIMLYMGFRDGEYSFFYKCVFYLFIDENMRIVG